MHHTIIRAALATGAVAAAVTLGAGTASADADSDYLQDLAWLGHPAKTQEMRDADIQLGHSICNYLANGATIGQASLLLQNGGSEHWDRQTAADYVAAATDALCPEYAQR